MRTLIVMMGLIMATAGCGYKYQPQTLTLTGGIPQNGSPQFNQGWRDGCDSGMAAFGNYTYKLIYTFRKDMTLINNPEYNTAWNSAYNTCRWYTSTWLVPPGGGDIF